jgi:thymidylate synthase
VYKDILIDLYYKPEFNSKPRNQSIKEKLNCSIEINNPTYGLYRNERRSSMYKYIAAELVWYFSGDNKLEFIEKYAKFWETIKNEDDTLNSAYGNLIFKELNEYGLTQWEWATSSLLKDKDTRQAILHFNNSSHQYSTNKDVVCTMYGIFHIRNNKLEFTLHMRSNDVILGLPTDMAFFTLLHQQMHSYLKKEYKIEISFPAKLYEETFQPLKALFIRHEGSHVVFGHKGNSPLFQQEISSMIEAKIAVNIENIDVFLKDSINITLYFSNGIKKHSLKLSETLTYNGKQLSKSDFTKINTLTMEI